MKAMILVVFFWVAVLASVLTFTRNWWFSLAALLAWAMVARYAYVAHTRYEEKDQR